MKFNAKKLGVILLIMFFTTLFTASFVSSEQKSLGVFQQGECIQLKQTCADCTYINFTRVSYPDSNEALLSASAEKVGTTFNYTFCNTTKLGEYIVEGVGDVEGTATIFSYDFKITYLGKELSEAKAILYIGFLTILILVFIINFVGIGFLPSRNTKDEEGRILSISYLKYFRNVLGMAGYFLFIGIIYISSNLAFAFLEEGLIAKTLFMIFQISFTVAPIVIIVWIVWIFVSMFHDNEFQKMLNRGVFPQGNL